MHRIALSFAIISLCGKLGTAHCQSAAGAATNLAVQFLGFTNSTATGQAALLSVTNGTSRQAAYFVDSLQVQSPQGWLTNSPAPGSWQFGGAARPSWQFAGSMQPFSNRVHLVTLPVTNATWRLSVVCMEQAPGVAGLVDKAKDTANKVVSGSDAQTFRGRNYWILTPEVTK